MELFKEEANTTFASQNEAIAAAQTKVEENAALVDTLNTEVEEVRKTQDT